MLALACTNCIIPSPRSWKDSDFKGSKVGSVQGIIHMTTKQQHVWLQRRSNGTVTSGIRGSQDYNTRHWILPPATEGGDFQLQMRPQLDGHFLRLQASESRLIKKKCFQLFCCGCLLTTVSFNEAGKHPHDHSSGHREVHSIHSQPYPMRQVLDAVRSCTRLICMV